MYNIVKKWGVLLTKKDIITQYIKENISNLDPGDLKFLLEYRAKMSENEKEKMAKGKNERLIYHDLSTLANAIEKGDTTSIKYKRLKELLAIYQDITKGKDLDEISYKLDRIYMELDMGVRKNSTLINILEKRIKNGSKYSR